MASETALLGGLSWTPPETAAACTYEAAGWSCRSTGFLWFAEGRDGGERLYPCPRCNTELFLARARARVSAKRGAVQCVCCGPGLARLAYESALDEVRRETDMRLEDSTGAANP